MLQDTAMLDDALLEFFRERMKHVTVAADTKLVDVLDSLTFLDFYLYLEAAYDSTFSLDDVVTCETLGQLSALVSGKTGSRHAS